MWRSRFLTTTSRLPSKIEGRLSFDGEVHGYGKYAARPRQTKQGLPVENETAAKDSSGDMVRISTSLRGSLSIPLSVVKRNPLVVESTDGYYMLFGICGHDLPIHRSATLLFTMGRFAKA